MVVGGMVVGGMVVGGMVVGALRLPTLRYLPIADKSSAPAVCGYQRHRQGG